MAVSSAVCGEKERAISTPRVCDARCRRRHFNCPDRALSGLTITINTMKSRSARRLTDTVEAKQHGGDNATPTREPGRIGAVHSAPATGGACSLLLGVSIFRMEAELPRWAIA